MKAQITALVGCRLVGRPGLLRPSTTFETSADVQKRKNQQTNCVHKPVVVREDVRHDKAYVVAERNARGSSSLRGVEVFVTSSHARNFKCVAAKPSL
jgi:hypothetical protein